jgi:hypothetical protein
MRMGKGKYWVEKERVYYVQDCDERRFWESSIDYIELSSGFVKLSVLLISLSLVHQNF